MNIQDPEDRQGFAGIYHTEYSVTDLFAMRQEWRSGERFVMANARPTDALLLFSDADAVCEQRGVPPIAIRRGSLVHIAAGSVYGWYFGKEGDDRPQITLLFEFSLYGSDGNRIPVGDGVRILTSEHTGLFENGFGRLIEEFSRPVSVPAALRAAAYELLAAVSGMEYGARQSGRTDTALIAAGIRYLEEDPVQDKSIREIAAMCGVSVNYFERLFLSYAGQTPSEYRTKRRLDAACRMLRTDMLPVERIAEKLGYYDSAYFCRVFRKHTGMTPGEYRRYRQTDAGSSFPVPVDSDRT